MEEPTAPTMAPGDDDALAAAARTLREHHDAASAGADPPDDGTRLWTLASVVWAWVPLTPDWDAEEAGFDPSPTRRGRRLRLACDAYGLDADERARLLDEVERWLGVAIESCSEETRERFLRVSWHVAELRQGWEPYL